MTKPVISKDSQLTKDTSKKDKQLVSEDVSVTDDTPPWTVVKININAERGSGTTYWGKEFIQKIFKDKKTGLQPNIKLIAKYYEKGDRICIEIEK